MTAEPVRLRVVIQRASYRPLSVSLLGAGRIVATVLVGSIVHQTHRTIHVRPHWVEAITETLTVASVRADIAADPSTRATLMALAHRADGTTAPPPQTTAAIAFKEKC